MRPIAWGDDFPAAMVLSARRTAELGVEFRREAFGYSTHSRTSSRAATLNTAMELEVFAFLFLNFAENLKSLRCPSRKWNHVVWRHSPARKKLACYFCPVHTMRCVARLALALSRLLVSVMANPESCQWSLMEPWSYIAKIGLCVDWRLRVIPG